MTLLPLGAGELTVAQAAARLVVRERIIYNAVAAGEIPVARIGYLLPGHGRGWKSSMHNGKVLLARDVDLWGRQRDLGPLAGDYRSVIVVDPEGRLADVASALRISGLEVDLAGDVFGALTLERPGIRPLLYLERPERGTPDYNVLSRVRGSIDAVFVGDVPVIPDKFDRKFWTAEHGEMRRMVHIAWMCVERRRAADGI